MSAAFWKEGVRFECQQSGKCCTSHGEHGYVYLTLDDRRRIAAVLGMRTSSFSRAVCKKTLGHWHLRETRGDCPFLEDEKCTVYEGRPAQCRTWPFWPENMNARAWRRDVLSFCPGVGKGPLHTAEEIDARLRQDPVLVPLPLPLPGA